MKKTVTFRILMFVLIGTIQVLECFSIPHDAGKRWTIKRSNETLSENANDESVDEITTVPNIEDICGFPDGENSSIRRKKRSEMNLFKSSAPNEITTDGNFDTTTIDYSHLSEDPLDFINCVTHLYIEPECYERLPNGSVSVPLYHKVYPRSDYLIIDDLLYICSVTEDMENDTTTKLSLEEICHFPEYDSPSRDREKRSDGYLFNLSALNETFETTTDGGHEGTTVDYSYLSEEFKNCDLIPLKPECYEKLPNGSVSVPLHDKVFPRSDYLILEDLLYVCPKKKKPATIEEICGSSEYDSPSSVRKKRSERYLFNVSAFNETDESAGDGNFNTTEDYSHLSAEFQSCAHIYLEPECYEKLPDGSVSVPLYDNKVFPRSDHFIDEDGLLFICPSFFGNGSKFPSALSIISVVGSSISFVCLVLHIIVYFCVKTVKNLPSRCLLSLCIALLCTYFFTFVQVAATGEVACRLVGMCMAYFFLASFFWMNVFSYDVWRSIRLATTKLRSTADRPIMVPFARYSLYAWGTPFMIAVVSLIVHHSISDVRYQLIFDDDICWFTHKRALTLYFAGPLFTLLGINILFTTASFFMISTAAVKSSNGKVSFDLWSRFFLSIRLGSSMGLMWIFGVIAIVTRQEWLWYLFAICGALQGVFIFCSFTVSERSRKEWRKALNSRKCSTMPTQISSQQTTSTI